MVDKIGEAKGALQDSVNKEDYDAIKTNMEQLKKALEEIGSNVYKGGENVGGSTGPEPPGPGGDANAQDADFKVEK